MPVYTGKAVKDGNLMDALKSTSFYATDGADGLGFMLAMLTPDAAFSFMGLGSKMIESLSASMKVVKRLEMAGKAEEAVTVLKGLGLSGKNIDSILGVTANTLAEAGSESKGVGDDLDVFLAC